MIMRELLDDRNVDGAKDGATFQGDEDLLVEPAR